MPTAAAPAATRLAAKPTIVGSPVFGVAVALRVVLVLGVVVRVEVTPLPELLLLEPPSAALSSYV